MSNQHSDLLPECCREAVREALTDALHPEFGYAWREVYP